VEINTISNNSIVASHRVLNSEAKIAITSIQPLLITVNITGTAPPNYRPMLHGQSFAHRHQKATHSMIISVRHTERSFCAYTLHDKQITSDSTSKRATVPHVLYKHWTDTMWHWLYIPYDKIRVCIIWTKRISMIVTLWSFWVTSIWLRFSLTHHGDEFVKVNFTVGILISLLEDGVQFGVTDFVTHAIERLFQFHSGDVTVAVQV